jgi:hypothetical protein
VRVGEADEYLLQALLCEVLAKVTHGVCPHNSNMVKLVRFLDSVPSNLFSHKVHQLIPNLKPQKQLVRQNRGKSKKQPSIATANINNSDILVIETIVSRRLVEGRVLDCIAVGSVVLFWSASEVEGVMGLPINKGVVGWEGERSGVERVDVGSHAVVLLFGDVGLAFDHLAIAFVVVRLLAVLLLALHKRNIIINL